MDTNGVKFDHVEENECSHVVACDGIIIRLDGTYGTLMAYVYTVAV